MLDGQNINLLSQNSPNIALKCRLQDLIGEHLQLSVTSRNPRVRRAGEDPDLILSSATPSRTALGRSVQSRRLNLPVLGMAWEIAVLQCVP